MEAIGGATQGPVNRIGTVVTRRKRPADQNRITLLVPLFQRTLYLGFDQGVCIRRPHPRKMERRDDVTFDSDG